MGVHGGIWGYMWVYKCMTVYGGMRGYMMVYGGILLYSHSSPSASRTARSTEGFYFLAHGFGFLIFKQKQMWGVYRPLGVSFSFSREIPRRMQSKPCRKTSWGSRYAHICKTSIFEEVTLGYDHGRKDH